MRYQMEKIPEFEDYSITKDGRIYSHLVHKYLNPWTNSGSIVIKLRKDSKVYKRSINSLLKKTFPQQHKQKEGYKFIPGFEDYSINRDGQVYSHLTKIHLKPFTVTENQQIYKFRKDGKSHQRGLNTLLRQLFPPRVKKGYVLIPKFEYYSINSECKIYSHLSNTYLVPSDQGTVTLRKDDKNHVRSTNALKNKVFPTEPKTVDLPGFKPVLEFENYSINPDGKIYNHKSNKYIKYEGKKVALRKDGKQYIRKVSVILELLFPISIDKEGFKVIPRFESYSISTNGEIYSHKRKKILKPQANNGYLHIDLRRDGKSHRRRVHRLVARTYLSNPDNKPQVNHKSGKKDCNNVDNLEWCTQLENNVHAIENGLKNNYKVPITRINKNGKVKEYESITEAAKDNEIFVARISYFITTDKIHEGYYWKRRHSKENLPNIKGWKEIKGYPGYFVSIEGDIYSSFTSRIRKPKKESYYRICLREKWFQIHRLVAQTYIPNPDNKRYVNHKDGNKYNNHVNNLEWVTKKENGQHASQTGLIKKRSVNQLTLNGRIIKDYPSILEAAQDHGVKPQSIGSVCSGKSRTCRSFRWEYQDSPNEDWKPPYTTSRRKEVIQLTKDGQEINRYPSLVKAIQSMGGINPQHIGRVCRGERKSYKGYCWKFV